jgi:mRNA interferase MazF
MVKAQKINRFDVFWVDLNPTQGAEISKQRPAIIVSPDEINHNLDTVIIAPITSTARSWPTRVAITLNDKKGQIALDQIRTISKERLKNKINYTNNQAGRQCLSILQEMFK